MKKLISTISILLITLFAVGGVYLNSAPGGSSEKEIFSVPQGSSFNSVVFKLEEQGFIRSALHAKIYGKFFAGNQQIKAGEYELNREMPADEILEILYSGKGLLYSITFQEGLNIYEMAQIIERNGLGKGAEFLKLVKDPQFVQSLIGVQANSLEGYLFPETYKYTRGITLENLVRIMVNNFKKNYKEIEGKLPPKFNKRQIITLASVIEKETGAPHERPMISSVFHNRLRKGMRLQSDPTILYGILDETGVYKKDIRKKDILRPTRYNTYTVSALPHGPIANPGIESLKAAVNPATSDFLYFVSQNNGTHKFTKTYKDHLKAVRTYQLNRKMRQGRSWRDLNKKKTN